jgi:hypothetical protein
MAKFEDVFPALREGKKIRRRDYPSRRYLEATNNFIYLKDSYETSLKQLYSFENEIFMQDWEIYEEPKQKVPYYPVLYKFFDKIKISDEDERYQNDLHFFRTRKNEKFEFIRLITEIPELIDWRDE